MAKKNGGVIELSVPQARRVVLAAQGFGRRPASPGLSHVRKVASGVHVFQIDSINVLARAHYIPAYSRLGPYPMQTIDRLAYERRELFEVWTHAACLVPTDRYPIFRYRMEAARAASPWTPGRSRPGSDYIEKVYEEVSERGPISARELSNAGKRRGKWWGWSMGKMAVEHLFTCGYLAIAGRRSFERLYDVAERVIPTDILNAPYPEADDARKQLICLAAKANGVATSRRIAGYLGVGQERVRLSEDGNRKGAATSRRLVAELVEEGRLVPAEVQGWTESAYMIPGTRVPRAMEVRTFVGPFDTLMRSSLPELCGFKQFLAQQLYVPAERRVYGYYVLPFLLDDELVARCDLKADRQRSVLMVQSAFVETGHDPKRVLTHLSDELRVMQAWLQLESIEVADRGNLAGALKRKLVRSRRVR